MKRMLITLCLLLVAPMTCSVTVADATSVECQQCVDSDNSLTK